MMTVVVIIVAALAAATLLGWLLTRRSGSIREVDSEPDRDTAGDVAALGLSRSGPTVVHFSAPGAGRVTGFAGSWSRSATTWAT